jgi:hypothetical protein
MKSGLQHEEEKACMGFSKLYGMYKNKELQIKQLLLLTNIIHILFSHFEGLRKTALCCSQQTGGGP